MTLYIPCVQRELFCIILSYPCWYSLMTVFYEVMQLVPKVTLVALLCDFHAVVHLEQQCLSATNESQVQGSKTGGAGKE